MNQIEPNRICTRAGGPASSSFLSGFAARAAAACLLTLALLLDAGAAHAQAPVDLSDIGGGCTNTDCPNAPTGSADGGPGGGEITVKWTPAATGGTPTSWFVSWQESGSTTVLGSEELTVASTRSHNITGLDAAKTYDISVRGDSTGPQGGNGHTAKATGVPAAPTPPTFESAAVNGATLTITFNEGLAAGSSAAPGDFHVTVGTSRRNVAPGGVGISGATVTLTLASAVTSADTVRVRYIQGANKMRDAVGNAVSSFPDYAVTNNTPVTVTGVAISSSPVVGDTYGLGEKIRVQLTFSSAVTVTGAPRLKIKMGAPGLGEKWADYESGSGTTALTFAYTVEAINLSTTQGIAVLQNSLALNGGAIKGAAENDATLTHDGLPHGADHKVNGGVDNKPPVFESAAVNGTTLTVTFDENLNTNSLPVFRAFHVTVGTIRYTVKSDGVAITGKVVTLTLLSAVTNTDTVKVRYEKPDTNPLQGADGNAVATFDDQAVTNNTQRRPMFSSASVNGVTLIVTFDEPLDESSAPPGAAFWVTSSATVGLHTGTGAATVSGAAVTVTLDRAVPVGATATLTYGPDLAGGNPVRNAAGEEALRFTNKPVTNAVLRPQPPSGGGGGVRRPDATPSFGDAAVAALALREGAAMEPAALPEAAGGDGELTYSLTSEPAGLAGLVFDPAARTLSGTPSSGGDYVFTYRVHDADANRADSDAAVLRFNVTVERPLDRAALAVRRVLKRTLAAVGARTLAGALTGVGARFADAAPQSGVRLAGRDVLFEEASPAVLEQACLTASYGRSVYERNGHAECGAAREVSREEFLRASAFNWTPASAGGGEAAGGSPLWAVWGRGDFGSFEGRPEAGSRYEGDTRTGWLGFDMRSGPWMAGVALAHGRSEADYDAGAEGESRSGRLETTLTALYPYGRWRFANGLELRAVVGAGSGEARHYPEGDSEETGDLEMRMASVGLRRPLGTAGGFDLAVRADASAVRLEMDNERPETTISGVSADGRRLRLGLEASRRLKLGGGASLTPFLEAAARHDSGDGVTGSGVELAGGARYEASRLRVEIRGRWLAAHSEEGASEHGVSVTVRMGPGAGGQGLWFALAPRWGAPAGGAEALWRDEMPRLRGGLDEGALDARVGYGFALARGGLLTPFAETGAGGGSSRVRLGTRFKASRADLAMELAGERRESEGADPVHGVRLDVRLGF